MATPSSEIHMYPEKLLEELKHQIAHIEANEPIISQRAKPCISLCFSFLLKFRDWVLNNTFNNHTEETMLFEIYKPKFYRHVALIAEIYSHDILGYVEKLKIEDLFTPIAFNPHTSILTVREKEIASYITEGRKHKEIAGILFISENTVRKHVENIYIKLDVKSKVELINRIGKVQASISNKCFS